MATAGAMFMAIGSILWVQWLFGPDGRWFALLVVSIVIGSGWAWWRLSTWLHDQLND